jgi:uncharacterized membrane protein YiaA
MSFDCFYYPSFGELWWALKDSSQTTLVAASGSIIIALMSVSMWNTMPLSHLHVVCNALFQNCIFGVDAAKTMLSDLLYIKFLQ